MNSFKMHCQLKCFKNIFLKHPVYNKSSILKPIEQNKSKSYFHTMQYYLYIIIAIGERSLKASSL